MISTPNLKKLPYFLAGLGFSTLSFTANASDWIVSPAVTLVQTYTDNALLSPEDEENESITTLRPSISIFREGGRASVDFNYAPEYRYYWEDTESDELVNFMRGEGNLELLEEHLFLDGWATADLTTITSTGRTGIGGLSGLDDSTEVYTAGFSPYFKSRLGNFGLFEARYTLDGVFYDEDDLRDNVGQEGNLVLGSGPAFSNQAWEVSARHSVVDYQDLDQDNEVSEFKAELIQQFTRKWALSFVAGYEEYELALNEDVDGSLWSVGVIYTPSQRTRLAIGGGERAFGDDYYLQFFHRSRRTLWTANYERDFTSAREELSRPALFARQDAFGNLVRDAVLDNPDAITRGESTASVSPEFFEVERVSTGFSFLATRTTLNLTASQTDRDYEDDLLDTRDLSATAGLIRLVSARTSLFINLRWTDHEEDLLDYDQWVAALGGSYQLGTNTSLDLRLAHLERDAEIDELSYEENSVSLSLTATF